METDASYVYRHIRPGIAFQATFNAQTLANVIEAVLKVDPLITYSEITRIATRSEGLLMQPARLNETQLGAFLTALSIPPGEEGKSFGNDDLFRKPHPDNYVYDQAGGRVRYRKPPEEFKVLRDEKRPGRRHRFRFWLRKPDTYEQVTRTVASFSRDARKLESAEGCPGRVPSKPGELAPVRANYQSQIKDLAPAWVEAFPAVRLQSIPPGLAPSIGSTKGFQLDIEGITGIRVEIRASQTGRMSLDADSQETVDALNFESHEYGLNIRMNSSAEGGLSHTANSRAPDRFVIIRVPRINLLRSVNNSSLESCRAYFLDADVPENATLIAEAETARVVARAGSRVFAMTKGRTDIETIGPDAVASGGRSRLVVLATSAAKETVRIGGRAADSVRISRIGSGETTATVREAQLVRVLLGRSRRWLNRYPKELPPAPATRPAFFLRRDPMKWWKHAVPMAQADTLAGREEWLRRLDVRPDWTASRSRHWFQCPEDYAFQRELALRKEAPARTSREPRSGTSSVRRRQKPLEPSEGLVRSPGAGQHEGPTTPRVFADRRLMTVDRERSFVSIDTPEVLGRELVSSASASTARGPMVMEL